MKKLISILVLSLFILAAQAQTNFGYTYIGQRYEWLGGLFKALGIPAGDTPDFINGQHRRAGQLFYDSTGVDSGLYVWSGLSWNQITGGGGGTTYYPGEGLAMSNDSLHLGGLIASPSYLQNERVINLNRKILHFTNGKSAEEGGAYWQFTQRPYSPYQFISDDTVTVNNTLPTIGRPLSGLYARRTVYFNPTILLTQQSYGHYFGQTYSWQDSMISRNDGMDYQQAVTVEQRYKPRGSGYQVIRLANGTGNDGRLLHATGTLVANTYYDGVDNASTDTLRARGYSAGVISYLVAATGSGKIKGTGHVYFLAGSLQNSNSNFGKTYVLARQTNEATNDSSYLLWDTLTTSRSHFQNLVLGKGDSTVSGYQFKIYGTTWQKGSFRYTDGNEGNLKVLTSDANGNATWVIPSGSSSQWINGTNGIYYPNYVGIGVDPLYHFHVKDAAGYEYMAIDSTLKQTTYKNGIHLFKTTNVTASNGLLSFYDNGANKGHGSFGDIDALTGRTNLEFDDEFHWLNLEADTVRVITNNFVPISDSSNHYMVVMNKTTGRLGKYYWPDPTGGAGGANTALSNLASVAINADLDPSSDNARDIGDGTNGFKDTYTRRVLMKGSTSGTVEITSGPLAQLIKITTLDGQGNAQSNYELITRADETWTNTTAQQDMFSNTAHNTFAVLPNTTYGFKFMGNKNSGATAHSLSFAMVPTTATISSISFNVITWAQAPGTAGNVVNAIRIINTSDNVIYASGGNANHSFQGEGTFTVGATGGFITPRIKLSVDPTGTISLKSGAEFTMWVKGNNTFTEMLPWQ